MDGMAVMRQLEKAQLDLAEVIDEVVFAENSQRKTQDLFDEFRLNSTRREEALVACIHCLSEYIHTLEQNIIVPAIGGFVTSLTDYHTSRNRSLAVQASEDVSRDVSSLSGVLERLQPPLPSTSSAALRDRLLANTSRFSVDDAYVMSKALAEECSGLQRLAKDSMASLHQYQVAVASRTMESLTASVSKEEMALLRGEVTYLRQLASAHQDRSGQATFLGGELEAIASAHKRTLADAAGRIEAMSNLVGKAQAIATSTESNSKIDHLQREILSRDARIDELTRAQESPRMADDSSVANSIHVVRLLQSEVTDLRVTIEEMRVSHEAALAKSKRRSDKLALQLAEASAASYSQSADSSSVNASLQRDYLAKIKAFELTIHTLNSELASLENRAASAETRFAEEVQSARMELQLERRDRRTEREEYDTMLNRVTTEIEKLMKENVELKQRIRQSLE